MYDTQEVEPEPPTRGPYYVPWKKTSMDAYKKYEGKIVYKKRYIPGSTLGNVPFKEKKDDNK